MDFKSLRCDKLKLSQEEFSNIYNVSLAQVQELDKTGNPGISLIQKIAENTGMDLNTICSYEKPKPKAINTRDVWEKTDFTKKSLVGYINSSLEHMDVPDDLREKYIDDFRTSVMSKFVKPTVAIVGRSDTGKSTLINSLIGAEKMPAKWTPTTSTAVYIKHIKDRPDFIHDEAWIFKRGLGNEKFWNPKRIYDEEYCKKWKIAGGDLGILETYSTRQGGGLKTEAGSAVVFVDAPVLLNCDIIDLPGYGTETTSDDLITADAAASAEVLIYLSLANGFLRIEDIEYLKNNVRCLPVLENRGENNFKPLANLFVVASHADTVDSGNAAQLDNILNSGCERFMSTLSDGYWKPRSKESCYSYTKNVIRDRFFTYTTDIPSLSEKFRNEFKTALEAIPEIVDRRCRKSVHAYVDAKKPSLEAEIRKYEALVEDRQKIVELLKKIRDSELKRTSDNDRKKREIKDLIHSLNRESLNESTDYFASVLTVDAITRKIKSRGIKNKKEEIQQFASRLQDEMQTHCSELLQEKSEVLSGKVQEYVNDFQSKVQVSFQASGLTVDFDAGYAFGSSLAKIGTIGGLAAFLAGNAVFVLASAPVIMSGVGTIALFAAILGPIGVSVGLAIAAAMGLAKLFGYSWEKSIAKKLVENYEKECVADKYRNAINEYWAQTESAFDQAAEELEQAWNEYVEKLESTVNSYDIERIENSLAAARNIQDFFGHIPL